MKIIDAICSAAFKGYSGGLDDPEIWRATHTMAFRAYRGEHGAVGSGGINPEELVAIMDDAGIEKTLLHASDLAVTPQLRVKVSPEGVARAVEKYPDRFVPGGIGIDPSRGMEAVRELEKAVKDYGFRSARVNPAWVARRKPPSDAIYYPVYAKCVELDIALCTQVRCGLNPLTPSYVCHPMHLENVAQDFPELRIVAYHTGWPWTLELIALCIQYPNIYTTTSGIKPSLWPQSFLDFINDAGRDRVLFGTGGPLKNTKDFMREIESLGIKDDVKDLFYRENTINVFKL